MQIPQAKGGGYIALGHARDLTTLVKVTSIPWDTPTTNINNHQSQHSRASLRILGPRVLLKRGEGGPETQKSKSLCTKNSQINISFCKILFFPTVKSWSGGGGGVRPPPKGDAELLSKTLRGPA